MSTFWKKYRELIVYLIVGLLTTVVSYAVRMAILYPFARIYAIDLNADTSDASASALRSVAQTVGWIAGVTFAFFPNKVWVFRDTEKNTGKTWRQFGKFAASRLFTWFVELGLAVALPLLLIKAGYKPFHLIVNVDADLLTMAISIVTITILNYVISKVFVFRKKKKEAAEEKSAEKESEDTYEPDR